MTTKKIEFRASNKHTSEVKSPPQPASKFLPQWYTQMPPYFSGDKLQLDPYATVTAKKCFPLLDGLTNGYIATLWADLFVKQVNGFTEIKWTTDEPVCDAWSLQQSSSFEVPDGFSLPVFKYLHGWIIKTPPEYSCLITHPVGYPNLPIRTITGIVDTDTLETMANSPFTIKKDFEGVIEKGTPMFQIFPFKREKWQSVYTEQSAEDSFFARERLYSKIVSSYGHVMRKGKSFK
jgi:hypothetical protein